MKKLLLSLAVAALAAGSALATTYKLFPGENLTWDGGTSGYTTTTVVEGKTFTIEIAKAKSTTNAAEPSADMIKVYKSSTITISSTDVDMKQVALKSSGGKYGMHKQYLLVGQAHTIQIPFTTLSPMQLVLRK